MAESPTLSRAFPPRCLRIISSSTTWRGQLLSSWGRLWLTVTQCCFLLEIPTDLIWYFGDERHEESLTFCICFQAKCQRASRNTASNFPSPVKNNSKMSQGSHQKALWYLSAHWLLSKHRKWKCAAHNFFIFITEIACKLVLVTITTWAACFARFPAQGTEPVCLQSRDLT